MHNLPITETCDLGHTFIKLPDHPKKDGLARCPHCLASGYELVKSEYKQTARKCALVIEYMRSACEHTTGISGEDDQRLLNAMCVGMDQSRELKILIPDYQQESFWEDVKKLGVELMPGPVDESAPVDAAITIQHGHILIRDNLIFHNKDTAIYIDGNNGRHATITGNCLIGSRPRWYQLRKWWSIIKTICKFCPPDKK